MLKRIIISIGVLVLVGGAICYAFLWPDHTAANKYQTAQITRGDVEAVITSTGTLSTLESVEVGTQISGIVNAVRADYNDHVKAGQVLATLDTSLLDVSRRSAEADLMKASAQHVQDLAVLQRANAQSEKGYLSQEELGTYVAQEAASQAGLLAAEIALQRANVNLSYATIRSPIDGIVIERSVDAGQTVAASLTTPTLFLIAQDLERMRIEAMVDENDIGQIKVGQSARFTVPAYPNEQFTGKVTQIRLQPTVQQNVVNYTVVIDATNREGMLLPGMTTTVEFLVEEAHDALLVPNAALRLKPTQEMMTALRSSHPVAGTARPAPPDGAPPSSGGRPPAGQARGPFGGAPPDTANLGRVWLLADDGTISMAPVRTGTTDGVNTAISALGPAGSNLTDGATVVTGFTGAETETKTPQKNSTMQGGPPPGGGSPF